MIRSSKASLSSYRHKTKHKSGKIKSLDSKDQADNWNKCIAVKKRTWELAAEVLEN